MLSKLCTDTGTSFHLTFLLFIVKCCLVLRECLFEVLIMLIPITPFQSNFPAEFQESCLDARLLSVTMMRSLVMAVATMSRAKSSILLPERSMVDLSSPIGSFVTYRRASYQNPPAYSNGIAGG